MAKKSDKGRRPKGRARERGEVRLVTFEIDPVLDDAVEAFMEKDRRSKRVVLAMALEEFLSKHGAWPPQPDDPPADVGD